MFNTRKREDEEEELIKYTYVNNWYSFSYTLGISFSLKKKKENFQVLQKSNCLYDYVLEYRADLTFSVYTAGDWLVVTYNRHVVH